MSGTQTVKWIFRVVCLVVATMFVGLDWAAAQAPHPGHAARVAAARHARARHVHQARSHRSHVAHAAHAVHAAHAAQHAHARPNLPPAVRVSLRHRPQIVGSPIVISPHLTVPTVIRTPAPQVRNITVRPTPPVIGRPDLAVVDIRVDASEADDMGEVTPCVTAVIQNLGRADYRSDAGSQVLALYVDGELAAQQEFAQLAAGETLELSVEAESGPAVYEARILFGDDIRQDGNVMNDDVRAQNDWLSRQLDAA